MSTLTVTETEQVLIDMLTENTGRHMLDSGGAYGRNFERNAGKGVAEFMERPEVHVETWERDGNTVVEYVTLDVFHFLRQRMEFDPELDAAFQAFALDDDHEREPWMSCIEEWFELVGARFQGGDPQWVNTYNGEDCLSQVLQYAMFEHPETGDPMVGLQIHGGCDVRGGYTAPRMFILQDEYELFQNADFTIALREVDDRPDPAIQPPMLDVPRPERYVNIDVRGGYPDRNPEPWDDDSLEVIDFSFGETPVTVGEDGTYTVADGPAKGWEIDFYPPWVS